MKCAANSVLGSSADFQDLDNDIPALEDDITEKECRLDVRDLRFMDDRGRSAMQHVQELCQTYELTVLSDAHAVQKLFTEVL